MSEQRRHNPGLRNRLWVKLIFWVGLALLAMFIVLAVFAVRMQEKQLIRQALQSSHAFSEVIRRATRYSMLKDQRKSIHHIIETVGQQPGVEFLRVFNKKGSIMFSSRKAETGTAVDMQGEACFGCHRENRPLERLPQDDRSRIFQTKGPGSHRVLGVINPIYTEKACYTDPCHAHPPEQKVLGVLDMGLSLARVDAEVKASTRQVIGAAVVIFLIVSSLLAVLAIFFVNRPLSALAKAASTIASGDYDLPVEVERDDEIGSLAKAFDSMRAGIKERTEALDASRREFKVLFEQVPCYVSVQDSRFKLVAFNMMFERDFHGPVGEFCYRAYKGRDSQCPNCAVARCFADGQVHSAEEEVISKDGTLRYFLNLATPIVDKEGNITSVMEMATDVTALRTLEKELRLSEEKYRLFFDHGPNPMLVLDQTTLEILNANQRAAAEYLYTVDQMTGRSFEDLVDPADRAKVHGFIKAAEPLLPRVQLNRADSTRVYVNIRASYGRHLGRPSVIVTTADITETMKAEQNLVQAAKMATLGEMSAGVAHELNQPLSVIATGSNVLRKQIERHRYPDPKILAELARELSEQVQRATLIINHLREFGRKAEVIRSAVSINEPIQGVFMLLGQQLKVHNIEINLDLAPNLPRIWGDHNRLEQVFINLVLNARDALEEQREHNDRAQSDCISVRSYFDPVAKKVTAEVSDNGPGINPEVESRIFEPFFTTKMMGKGTGLGLSISYGIIRDYDGEIEVHGTDGGGATFRISFPPAKEET